MYTVSLPPIGEGIQEGEIVKWTVKPGDSIKKDDELVEVMTDKITVKIPSPVAGKVSKILIKEGETAMIGDAMVEIDSPDESNSPEKPAEKPATTAHQEVSLPLFYLSLLQPVHHLS